MQIGLAIGIRKKSKRYWTVVVGWASNQRSKDKVEVLWISVGTPLDKLFTPCARVKRHNLVSINGQWRSAAGKVTVDLHWPCIIDFSDLTTYRFKAYTKKRWAPRLSSRWTRLQRKILFVRVGCLACGQNKSTKAPKIYVIRTYATIFISIGLCRAAQQL